VALVLDTTLEMMIAAHFRTGQEAFYAADAALERALDELGNTPNWNDVLQGAAHSTFTDGSASAGKQLSDGAVIDLPKITNQLNCGHAANCTPAEMDASTAERPWALNNPRWVLYAYGQLSRLVLGSGSINSTIYTAAWVADDQSDNDDDPTRDGDDPSNPGRGVIVVHAEAFGPGGAHKVIESTVSRAQPGPGIRVIAWRRIN
jgi:hypothetical protein